MELPRSSSSSPKSSSSQSSYDESRLGESSEEEGMQDCVGGAADEKDLAPECTPPSDGGGENGIMMTVPPMLQLLFTQSQQEGTSPVSSPQSPISRSDCAASQRNENNPRPPLTQRQPNLQPMPQRQTRKRRLSEVCL